MGLKFYTVYSNEVDTYFLKIFEDQLDFPDLADTVKSSVFQHSEIHTNSGHFRSLKVK